MKDIKVINSNAEINTYDDKFSEVFCNKELCGYIVKVNNNYYHSVTSDGEQCKLCDDMDSAISGLIIQYLKSTGELKNTPDFILTSGDKEKLTSTLKCLFEKAFSEYEHPGYTAKRVQEKKHHHPVH
ncbi:hypothetical protein ELS07_07705 [Salmonella enterica subsp. enterica serovar Lomalinda]|nr:hypothetical protein [Salmonella enterica subsp. enterica serovar Lomalinda]ECI5319640.1 hypothetical protein [Salmonella enterica subsp. enterica serovar Lomalinda]